MTFIIFMRVIIFLNIHRVPHRQHTYTSSAAAEMGDRLATIDMGQKLGGLLCPFEVGSWVPI